MLEIASALHSLIRRKIDKVVVENMKYILMITVTSSVKREEQFGDE